MKTKPLVGTERTAGLGGQLKQFLGTSLALVTMILMTGCASDEVERTAGETIDDQATSARVQNALSSDPAYKYTEVKVTTMQGKVQLSGFVDKDEQKDRASEIAKKTKGVKDVKNDIALR